MNKGRYKDTPRERWLRKLNKSSESAKDQGQKLQLPVRFESKTLNIIEKISTELGISKSKVVRILVSKGLNNLRLTSRSGDQDETRKR